MPGPQPARARGDLITLVGRLAAIQPEAGNPYNLLLHTHRPDGRRDESAQTLLSTYPPHVSEIVPQPGDGEELEISLPYQLLIPLEKAKEDFARFELGRHGDRDGAVCSVQFRIATTGAENTEARQAYWFETLSQNAGKWVTLTVKAQRYSFTAKATRKRGPVKRMGTKLTIAYLEPLK